MISLEIACKNAETMMLKYGDVKGFLDIRETDTKWFFVGSLSEDGPCIRHHQDCLLSGKRIWPRILEQ